MILMFLYEYTKHLLYLDISTWQSHLLTMIFSTIVAVGGGYFFSKKEGILKRQLADSLSFHQQLLDNIPIPIFHKNEEYIYTGCNKSYEDFLGIDRQTLIGKSVYDIAPTKLAEVYHEKDLELISNHRHQIYECEVESDAFDNKRQVIFHKATIEKSDGQIGGLIGAILDITDRRKNEQERDKLLEELKKALKEIKTLKGIIPICSYCKQIRDEKGAWDRMEAYICSHSDAQFSHGICPECYDKHKDD